MELSELVEVQLMNQVSQENHYLSQNYLVYVLLFHKTACMFLLMLTCLGIGIYFTFSFILLFLKYIDQIYIIIGNFFMRVGIGQW